MLRLLQALSLSGALPMRGAPTRPCTSATALPQNLPTASLRSGGVS